MGELVWSVFHDKWRDLGPDLRRVGTITVVTTSGTTRIIDADGGRHLRQTLEGNRRSLWGTDGLWLPIRGDVRANPCGVFITTGGPRDWEASTRLWATWAGIVPKWSDTDLGERILASVLDQQVPPTPTDTHPRAGSCMYYCALREDQPTKA